MTLTNKVLIAYSKNFNNKKFFSSKTDFLLKNVEKYSITALYDHREITREKFGNTVHEHINHKLSSKKIAKLISQHDYIIFFWDGTTIDEYIYQSALQKKKFKIVTIETTKVANKDKGEEYDVYIGRGSPWGNPYAIGQDGLSRDEVIEKFREYFSKTYLNNPEKHKELLSLKNKKLGCHCSPLACHGDIIADYLNSLDEH